MYRIKKIFNNNIALVEDQDHNEQILLGSGIAFHKKGGDTIDQSRIDKRFILDTEDVQQKFHQLFAEIPVSYIELTVRIVEKAESMLGTRFNDLVYIGLSDHLRYALDRSAQGIDMHNALLWEIKRFYPKEYQVAQAMVELIYYYEKQWLSDNEIGYIALHFVNAQSNTPEMKITIELTEIIRNIMKIIQLQFKVEIDESSLNYTRFTTHISYFMRRIMQGELSQSDDSFVYEQLRKKYPETYKCAKQIENYLHVKLGVMLTEDELLYFMIHINRIVKQ